jgi:hypothetical protein
MHLQLLHGCIDAPEYDGKFKSTWSSPAQILGVIGEFQPTWDEE